MKNDLLANRHIGISEKDEAQMLHKIGVASLDELIDKTIPTNIRLKAPLALPEAMTEYEFGCHIAELAAKNKLYTTYIGMGWYNTITPAVIQRNVFENPVWYTSYTPYQTEVSQGRLEALMNFQTAVCDLTGMPLANCSLLDEATAAAEAVTMMYALRPREMQKSGANVVFVDESIFPQTLAVITTRAIPQGIEIRTGRYNEAELTPDTFACILQYPNGDGNIEDYRTFVENAHAAGCKVAVAADILSLALLTPPGEWGADIVFGTTQRLGTPMFYGGPSAAYFATRDEYKRNMPGRIIGWSKDKYGKLCYRMALQTREQHIKRNFQHLYSTGTAGHNGRFLCRISWTGRYPHHCKAYSQHCRISGKRNQQIGIQASECTIFRYTPLCPARQRIGTTSPYSCPKQGSEPALFQER